MTATHADRIAQARVLIIGLGGLGSPAALALAQAGVGRLGLCDDDAVDVSNLHRQILHGTGDVGARKVDSAKRCLAAYPATEVACHAVRFDASTAPAILSDYDVIVDGSDNFATKFLVSDLGVAARKPFVIGAALRWVGQVLSWDPGASGGCYRCLFEEPPEEGGGASCQEAGIVGPVCGVIGGLQAAAVLDLIERAQAPSREPPSLSVYDALGATLRRVPVPKNPGCKSCFGTAEALAPASVPSQGG